MTILAIPLMALANRWRGGGWPFLPGEIHGGPNDHKRTQVRRIAFAAMGGLLAWNPWVALILYLSTLTGWGFPVSAAIGARSKPAWQPEWAGFDYLAHSLSMLRHKTYSSSRYGVVWLTLHGLLFGAMTSGAMDSIWPLLWAGMGFSYWLARNWEKGELYDGALKGLGISLALVHHINN